MTVTKCTTAKPGFSPRPDDDAAEQVVNPQGLSEDPWRVHTGDAWDLAADLPAASVHAVVTSPPYWGLRSYGHVHDPDVLVRALEQGFSRTQPPPYHWYRDNGGVLGLEPYPSWFVAHLVELFDAVAPAIRLDGSVWINLGDTYFGRWSSIRDDGRQGLGAGGRERRVTPSGGVLHDKQLLMVPARFALAMQDAGWILRNDMVWHKPNVPPRPERDRLRLAHEHFFHFVKRRSEGRPRYFYDIGAAEPGATDVVTVATSNRDSKHSATFPLELVRPRILTSSPVGGTILDPFCGTGTALVAAVEEERKAIGFELSPLYAECARQRLRCDVNDPDDAGRLGDGNRMGFVASGEAVPSLIRYDQGGREL